MTEKKKRPYVTWNALRGIPEPLTFEEWTAIIDRWEAEHGERMTQSRYIKIRETLGPSMPSEPWYTYAKDVVQDK